MQQQGGVMLNIPVRFGHVKKFFRYLAQVLLIGLSGYMHVAIAESVTNISIDAVNGEISWMANGVIWYAAIEKDQYFGDTIPIISIDLETGDEALEDEISNCFYRGQLIYSDGNPISQTYAYINLCHTTIPFSGFVSDSNGIYTIEEDPSTAGQLLMLKDDFTAPFIPPGESNAGNNNRGSGGSKLLKPDTQITRSSSPETFPSVEFVVEASFVETYGRSNFIHRIASTFAFANFVYQQSDIKQIHLTSIDVLNGDINRSGGQGSVRHQLSVLRRGTIQAGSGDVSVLMLGGHVNTTDLLGYSIDANACELQIAVAEGDKLNSIDIGRSAAFVIDLASFTQRGWIFAHEFAHAIGAMQHVNNDPLMDSWFPYIESLSGYVAGCGATTQIFKSCEVYEPKTRKVTNYYTCD
ncbi:MAG: hypothetical protein QNK31_10880 [Porticoccus sp.]|nr:hypothetical protein [Porticoccus sp.]